MKKIIASLIGLLAFTGVANAELPDQPKFLSSVVPAVVRVNDGCTGTVIKSNKEEGTWVLTARHCVSSTNKIVVATPKLGRKITKEEVYYADYVQSMKRDLAILKLKDKSTIFPSLKVAHKDYQPLFGDQIFTVGYPLEPTMTVTEGLFTGREDSPVPSEDGDFYRQTPPAAPGNSGGPVLDFYDGEYHIIGVLTRGASYGHINLSIPNDVIWDFLDSWQVRYSD